MTISSQFTAASTSFLLGFLFEPEGGGDMLYLNYTAFNQEDNSHSVNTFCYVTFEAFMTNKYANIFPSNQPCQHSFKNQRFRDLLCLYHKGQL